MRFTERWASATRFPTTMVTTASHQITCSQMRWMPPNASSSTRTRAANAAALTAVAMNPVTGVGAPSYTSGVHMWNGTAATLKPKPISSRAMPPSSIGCTCRFSATIWPAIIGSLVEPVAPYSSAMP